MPRYYFDLRDGEELLVDEEGIELPTLARVQEEAANSLADFAKDTVRMHGLADGAARQLCVEVRDEDGPVMQARFAFDIGRTRR